MGKLARKMLISYVMAYPINALSPMNSMNPLRHLRACSWCGRALMISHDLYCRVCLHKLMGLLEWREVKGLPLKTYSLGSMEQERVYHLICKIKGGKYTSVFNDLSFLIWRTMGLKTRKKPVFIPAPPKATLTEDHATKMAQSLSAIWGGSPYWNGLYRKSTDSQKRLNQKERKGIQLSRYLPPPPRTSDYIFVDDVVTTGSTALAAYERLGLPPSFSVWTIAHTPRQL